MVEGEIVLLCIYIKHVCPYSQMSDDGELESVDDDDRASCRREGGAQLARALGSAHASGSAHVSFSAYGLARELQGSSSLADLECRRAGDVSAILN